jgi:hypothetical protein
MQLGVKSDRLLTEELTMTFDEACGAFFGPLARLHVSKERIRQALLQRGVTLESVRSVVKNGRDRIELTLCDTTRVPIRGTLENLQITVASPKQTVAPRDPGANGYG